MFPLLHLLERKLSSLFPSVMEIMRGVLYQSQTSKMNVPQKQRTMLNVLVLYSQEERLESEKYFKNKVSSAT